MMRHQIRSFTRSVVFTVVLASAMGAGQAGAFAADSKDFSAEKQRKLIGVLKSDTPPEEKAIACKQLAVCGTKDAVPALAALLSDPRLASWARIALEAIPGPAANAALRKAMGELQGKLLIGTINSIAVRRDAKAVAGLVKKLKEADPEVASAAAVALGRIGGATAAKALEPSLANVPAAVRPAVAEGCVLCAEGFLAQGKPAEAVKLCDAVRKADVPKQRILEATRGAILARQSAGIPLLLEQLRSPDKAFFAIGLRTARELNGPKVTEALVAELKRCNPDRQGVLLLAVADRGDAAALSAVLEAARRSPTKVRIVAMGVLERRGNLSSVPVLLEAAAGGEAEVAQAAFGALTRLPGNEVDSDFLGRLPQATGKRRQVLIELAGRRRIEAALPSIVGFAKDSDAGVRSAAAQAIGTLGDDKQAGTLVLLLQKSQNPKERADLEMALIAIGGRSGARCVPHLLPLAQSDDSALRIIALHLLASAGGPEALAIVKPAVDDKDEAVRDEAVRTLSTWPNNWPEEGGVVEPLLALAKTSTKTAYQVLGLRGYLQYVQGARMIKDEDKVGKVNEVLPLIKRPEEQRLAIGVVGAIPTAGALKLLMTFTAEPAVADDACSALVKLAGDKAAGISREERQQALQTVVEKSKNAATKKKAEGILKEIQ
jgi:HEAT repeat protein